MMNSIFSPFVLWSTKGEVLCTTLLLYLPSYTYIINVLVGLNWEK